MIRARSANRRLSVRGFSLTEIVLALAVISTALIAVLGVLPAGIDSSRQATNHTAVALILEDLRNRLRNETLQPGPASFSPAYFDGRGVYLDPQSKSDKSSARIYRADVEITTYQSPPANTSALRPVKISLSWPVDPVTGMATGNSNPQTVVTFGATTLTGPAWPQIDPTYTPKIEF